MTRRVVVTGQGQVSALGNTAESAFRRLAEGRSAIGWHHFGETPPIHDIQAPAALCEGFDPTPRLPRKSLAAMDRFAQMGAIAALDAWHDAGLDDASEVVRDLSSVCWGTGVGGVQSLEKNYWTLLVSNRTRLSPLAIVHAMNNAAASHISMLLNLGGACVTFSVACASSASGFADAHRRIASGECDLALAGGSEAMQPYGVVRAWQAMQVMARTDENEAVSSCQPFGAERTGLVLGEGAAALVLEERDHAIARGARIYAEIGGSGSSSDHSHLTAPSVDGQLRALRQALRQARVDPTAVRYINAHGTATQDGDRTEIETLRRLFGDHAPRVAVSSTKSMHGHLLGASGAIELWATVMGVHHRVVLPTAGTYAIDDDCKGVDHVQGVARHDTPIPVALCNSFAFGGSNVSIVVKAHH